MRLLTLSGRSSLKTQSVISLIVLVVLFPETIGKRWDDRRRRPNFKLSAGQALAQHYSALFGQGSLYLASR